MKKLIAVLLALVMVMSLGVSAFAAEEEEIDFVGGVVIATDIEILAQLMDSLGEELGEQGIDFQYVSANFDPSVYPSLIENYVTMGADVIVVVPMETSGIKDAAVAAEEAGAHVIYMSSPPDYGEEISGGVYNDQYAAGLMCSEMAASWANENYPDAESIPVAMTYAEGDPDSIARQAGLREGIEEDEICEISYEFPAENNAVDEGYNFAEEALVFNPDIRVFIVRESNACIGVDNYIRAYVEGHPELSVDDFAVFGVGYGDTVNTMIEDESSAIRGVVAYTAIDPAAPVMEVINHIAEGGELPYWLAEEAFSVNSFGYGAEVEAEAEE